jgi:hypothetical protein
MLRITTDKNTQCLTLRLEGRLEGPWVAVLTQSFSGALHKLRGRRLRVDLGGVTFVDAEGKAALAQMYAQGAQLLGEDLENKAIVAQIRSGRAGDGADGDGGRDSEARDVARPKAIGNLHEQLADLQRLQAELSAVNEELVQAARPLERLDEMNDQERHQLADQMRAKLARWESVTQRINQVLGINGEKGNEGGSR